MQRAVAARASAKERNKLQRVVTATARARTRASNQTAVAANIVEKGEGLAHPHGLGARVGLCVVVGRQRARARTRAQGGTRKVESRMSAFGTHGTISMTAVNFRGRRI